MASVISHFGELFFQRLLMTVSLILRNVLGIVPVNETFRKLKGADGPAPTTDTLGLGPKSPFVNDEGKRSAFVEIGQHATAAYERPSNAVDFKVGARPEPGTPSARFGEWHRPGSKISQPPGGASSNIFGS